MSEVRQHPDVFTPEEAVKYMHLDEDSGERTLATLRENGDLIGHRIGKGYMYHRANLDACIARLFGIHSGNGRGGR